MIIYKYKSIKKNYFEIGWTLNEWSNLKFENNENPV